MTITEKAVEAAAEVLWRVHPASTNSKLWRQLAEEGTHKEVFRRDAREALAAAVPHMLETISTRAELEALWLGSVVFSEGIAYQRFGNDDWAGEGRSFGGGQIELPAAVLHNPSPYRSAP